MSQRTTARIQRVTNVLENKQPDLTVVCENIHDPHNVSAVLRTCDAVGIRQVHLYYDVERFPKFHYKTSASALKWTDRQEHRTPGELVDALKGQGMTVYGTHLSREAVSLYDVDWTLPSAIILGNEHRGMSDPVLEITDQNIFIPMFGMIQSLNVSVAAAVILYEASRQRMRAGMYPNPQVDEVWLKKTREMWLER